jgi:hypothetical protein
VPARVASGLHAGTEQADGSRLITSDDAHAWVEVYFDDLGWVPFDPTPISARPRGGPALGTAPARTTQGRQPDRSTGADRPSTAAAATPRTGTAADAGRSGPGDDGLRPLVAGGSGWPLVPSGRDPGGLRARAAPGGGSARGPTRALWDELTATALGMRVDVPGLDAAAGRARARRRDGPVGHVPAEAPTPSAGWPWPRRPPCYGPAGTPSGRPELAAALRTARRGCCGGVPARPARGPACGRRRWSAGARSADAGGGACRILLRAGTGGAPGRLDA